MNGQCQTSAQWFDTRTQPQTIGTPVLSGAVLMAAPLDLRLSLFRSAGVDKCCVKRQWGEAPLASIFQWESAERA